MADPERVRLEWNWELEGKRGQGTGNDAGKSGRIPASWSECLKFRFYVWPAQANHGMFETAILNRVWRFGLELNKACVLQRRFACTLHGSGVLF